MRATAASCLVRANAATDCYRVVAFRTCSVTIFHPRIRQGHRAVTMAVSNVRGAAMESGAPRLGEWASAYAGQSHFSSIRLVIVVADETWSPAFEIPIEEVKFRHQGQARSHALVVRRQARTASACWSRVAP